MDEVLGNPPKLLVDRIDYHGPDYEATRTSSELERSLRSFDYSRRLGQSGTAMEKSLDPSALAQMCRIRDLLTITFPELGLAQRHYVVQEVVSLLAATMLRILAGVYHIVVQTHGKAEAAGLLQKLANHTQVPINGATPSGRLWINCGTEGTFIDGASNPQARAQQVEEAITTIASWASNPPAEL